MSQTDEQRVRLRDMSKLLGVRPATPYTWRTRRVLPPPDSEDPLEWEVGPLIAWYLRRKAETAPSWQRRAIGALERNQLESGPGLGRRVEALAGDPLAWIDGRELDERVLAVLIHEPDEEPEQEATA